MILQLNQRLNINYKLVKNLPKKKYFLDTQLAFSHAAYELHMESQYREI